MLISGLRCITRNNDIFLLNHPTSVEVTITLKLFCDKFTTLGGYQVMKQNVVSLLEQRGFIYIASTVRSHYTVLNNVHYLTVFKSAMAFKKRGKEHINIFRKTETHVITILADYSRQSDFDNNNTFLLYNVFAQLNMDLQAYIVDLREHSRYTRSISYCMRKAILAELLK